MIIAKDKSNINVILMGIFKCKGYVFYHVGLFVCLYVRLSDYLKSNERICIKRLYRDPGSGSRFLTFWLLSWQDVWAVTADQV